MKLKKYFFNSVSSTNDEAMQKIRQDIISGIIIAKKQTKGRGRYGNKWIYMKNNLFMSVFFSLNSNIVTRELTETCCRIVHKSLVNLLDIKIKVKKPNDLMISKKKVCGILQEIIIHKQNKFAVIGIGINVDSSPNIKKYSTTHLNLYTKKRLTISKIFNEIKRNFEDFLNN